MQSSNAPSPQRHSGRLGHFASAVGAILLYLLSQIAVLLFLTLALGEVLPEHYVLSNLTYLLLLALYSTARHRGLPPAVLNSLRSIWLGPLVIALVAGVVLNLVLGRLLLLLPQDMLEQYTAASASMTSMTGVWRVVAIGLVAPLTEELLFRGIVLGRLRLAMPTEYAVVLSSLLFGIGHLSLVWVCYSALMGSVLALFYLRNNNLIYAIVCHISFNMISLVM